MNFKDISNKKIGDWKVIEYVGKSYWKCECKCGNVKNVNGASLRSGKSKNCGCKKIKHGYDGTKIYRLWGHMKERCYYEKHKSYKYYGERGIKVCEEWKEASVFIKWALDNGYKEGLTLDRINTDGDYEPSNCRFITNKDQQRNKRNNRFITINNTTKTVSEWAEISNLDRHTVLYRLNKGYEGFDLLKPGRKGGGISANFKERID